MPESKQDSFQGPGNGWWAGWGGRLLLLGVTEKEAEGDSERGHTEQR